MAPPGGDIKFVFDRSNSKFPTLSHAQMFCISLSKKKLQNFCVNLKKRPKRFSFEKCFRLDYPESQIKVEKKESNFPASICYYMVCNANEIARRRVEPPRSKRANLKTFSPQPHINDVLKFLLADTGHRYPTEECVLCKKQGFNENPADVVRNPKGDLFVTRLYCGHIFHYKCLNEYMTKPPFKVLYQNEF